MLIIRKPMDNELREKLKRSMVAGASVRIGVFLRDIEYEMTKNEILYVLNMDYIQLVHGSAYLSREGVIFITNAKKNLTSIGPVDKYISKNRTSDKIC